MRRHLLPLALAACVASTAVAQDATLLGGYHWQLTHATDHGGQRIDALFVRPDKPLQLDFANGRVSVRNACNGAGGSYRIANGQLLVGPMMHTMMGCREPGLNQLDVLIGQRLASHPAITVTQQGDTPQLQLRTPAGDTLDFTGAPRPQPATAAPASPSSSK